MTGGECFACTWYGGGGHLKGFEGRGATCSCVLYREGEEFEDGRVVLGEEGACLLLGLEMVCKW